MIISNITEQLLWTRLLKAVNSISFNPHSYTVSSGLGSCGTEKLSSFAKLPQQEVAQRGWNPGTSTRELMLLAST